MSGILPAPYDPTDGRVSAYIPAGSQRRWRRALAIALQGGGHAHAIDFGSSITKGFVSTGAGKSHHETTRIVTKRVAGLPVGSIGSRFAASNEVCAPQFSASTNSWDTLFGIGDGAVFAPAGTAAAITTTCAQYLCNYGMNAGLGNLSVTDSLAAISIGPIATAGAKVGFKVATSALGADAARTLTMGTTGAGCSVVEFQFISAAETAGTFLLWNGGFFGGTWASHLANSTKWDLAGGQSDIDVALCIFTDCWQNYNNNNWPTSLTELETLITTIVASRVAASKPIPSVLIWTPYPSVNLTLATATQIRGALYQMVKRLNAQASAPFIGVLDVFNLLGDCTPAVDLAATGNQFTDGSVHLVDKGHGDVGYQQGQLLASGDVG